MKKTIYTLAAGMLASSFAFAQDSTKTAGKFTLNGYIDSYYNYRFQNESATTDLNRPFDVKNNQFALGLVQTRFAYTNRNSELVMDLVFGPYARLANFGNLDALLGGVAGADASATGVKGGNSVAIKQAFFKYNLSKKFNFTVGQFATHIGYEGVDAPNNFNYSLSNLFNNGPFYHIGAKIQFIATDWLRLTGGVVNNWDNLVDYKTQKSLMGVIAINPSSKFGLYLNWIGGYGDDPSRIPSTAGGTVGPYTRHLFDLSVGLQATDKLYFGLNAAYGMYNLETGSSTGKDTTYAWGGVAGYVNYKFTDFLGLGVRYEHFNNKSGARGGIVGTINNALTVTMPITLSDGHVILKPEFRIDAAPGRGIYKDNNGNGIDHQTTIGMAFIYKY
ncbi:MAG: porin [Cytophagales bacterium]|nr:MAG: porin [Cytophagales bacterium]